MDETYKNLFDFCSEDNTEYYILIGQDQLYNLNKWYKFELIKENFKFIVANRNNELLIKSSNYLYLENKNYNISSTAIKDGVYKNIHPEVKRYIIDKNIYPFWPSMFAFFIFLIKHSTFT